MNKTIRLLGLILVVSVQGVYAGPAMESLQTLALAAPGASGRAMDGNDRVSAPPVVVAKAHGGVIAPVPVVNEAEPAYKPMSKAEVEKAIKEQKSDRTTGAVTGLALGGIGFAFLGLAGSIPPVLAVLGGLAALTAGFYLLGKALLGK